MADNKKYRELLGLLVEQGFQVNLKNSGHYEVRSAPTEENPKGEFLTTMSATPSEHRAWMNALALLRRAGLKDPWRPHKAKAKRDTPPQP